MEEDTKDMQQSDSVKPTDERDAQQPQHEAESDKLLNALKAEREAGKAASKQLKEMQAKLAKFESKERDIEQAKLAESGKFQEALDAYKKDSEKQIADYKAKLAAKDEVIINGIKRQQQQSAAAKYVNPEYLADVLHLTDDNFRMEGSNVEVWKDGKFSSQTPDEFYAEFVQKRTIYAKMTGVSGTGTTNTKADNSKIDLSAIYAQAIQNKDPLAAIQATLAQTKK